MENKNENEAFSYTYSAKQQEEIEKIRKNTYRLKRIKWSSCDDLTGAS